MADSKQETMRAELFLQYKGSASVGHNIISQKDRARLLITLTQGSI